MNETAGVQCTWRPQPGPQTAYVQCTTSVATEIFYGGARGGGKTDGTVGKQLIKAMQFGRYMKGIVFRRELPQLEAIIQRSKELMEPHGGVWKEQSKVMRFPTGASVKFRFMDSADDHEKYQGHDYTDIAFEELGNFHSPNQMLKLKACLRSAHGIPCQLYSTGNPGGPGQSWIKSRYIDPAPPWTPIKETERIKLPNGDWHDVVSTRIYIPARVTDNQILLRNDPNYLANLTQAGSEQLVRAWLYGDFNAVDGAFFDNFDPLKHVLPWADLPAHWLKFRAADWGSYHPFAVLWMAIASEPWQHPKGRIVPKGAIVVYREWYGCRTRRDGTLDANVGLKMAADQVARGIVERTPRREGIAYSVLDPSAFARDGGPSIAERMYGAGALFRRADNARTAGRGPMGGWDQVRARLDGEPDERDPKKNVPLLYIMDICHHLLRTLPMMQHDPDNPEDMETNGEDHACFAAGTLVDTAEGPQTIETLRSGFVRTVGGYAPFTAARTGHKNVVRATFSDGTQIVCTPDHLFAVAGGRLSALSGRRAVRHGILRLDVAERIKCQSELYLQPCRSSAASAIIYAANTFRSKASGCIASCGRIITAQFRRACTSTTRATTDQIIRSTTSSCSPRRSTLAAAMAQPAQRARCNSNQRQLPQPPSGTGVQRAALGTSLITRRTRAASTSKWSALARIAPSPQQPLASALTRSAAIDAKAHSGEPRASTTLSERALSAATSFLLTGTKSRRRALAYVAALLARRQGLAVLKIEPAGTVDVYCLSVPATGLFTVEGGILVSNCDALRYGLMSRPYIIPTPAKALPSRFLNDMSLEELWTDHESRQSPDRDRI